MAGPTAPTSPVVAEPSAHSPAQLDLSDARTIVPLDRVEFRREVELTPGLFAQVLTFGQPVKRRGGTAAESVEVFAWLDGDYVILSTGQEMHVAGGLVDLFVRGE